LRAAARHWHDPASIVGRLPTKNAGRSWQDIAMSALDGESPLALAADELMKLENAVGLVDVCLICAANFGGAKVRRDDSKELGETPVEGMFDWERGLYHQPPIVEPGDMADAQSSTQSIVSGIQANSSDALKACHSILFFYISKLLGEGGVVNQRLAEELVAACASSTDVKFLRSLYDQLVATHNVDTLLRIDSSTLEDWLKEKNDVNLVWKYYSFHGRNVLAGDEMSKMALDKIEKTPLVQRIECLTRASNSYSAALQAPVASEPVSVQDLQDRIIQITEQLDVAAIQQRVLAIAEQSENTHLDSAKMDALSFSLVSVSDLYNEYAGPLNLFDICLLLMETCRQNDSLTIKTLWKSIVCEEIFPCGTNSRVAFEYLNELKDDSMVDEDIIFGQNNDDTLHQFENGSWVSRLIARVTELGKSLYGKGADYTFPLDMLLETLEGEGLYSICSSAPL
jgi:nuclear pore complex protein Nup155